MILNEQVAILIGVAVWLVLLIVALFSVKAIAPNIGNELPRATADGGTVLYNRKATRVFFAVMCAASCCGTAVISIIEYVLGSILLGTVFIVLCAVFIIIGVASFVYYLRYSVVLIGNKIVQRGIMRREIGFDEIAYFNTSAARLTLYDKYGIPVFARLSVRLVGFELLVSALIEHGAERVAAPFPPKQFKVSKPYKSYIRKEAGGGLGGACLIFAVLAAAIAAVAIGTAPPAELDFVTVTGTVSDFDDYMYRIWLDDDGDWFCVNSIDRRAMDKAFWNDVGAGCEITIAYYHNIGKRRDVGYIEYNGKVYLDGEQVKKLESEERQSMLSVSYILLYVSAGLVAVGATGLSAALAVYKKERAALKASDGENNTV